MIERAEWIWLSGCQEQNAYVDFKKAFVAREGEPIEIELSVDGNYALYLNDRFVDSGQYPDYPQYKVYDRLDLTEWVQEGENELKIRVWWPVQTIFPIVLSIRCRSKTACIGKFIKFVRRCCPAPIRLPKVFLIDL